ncbi:MAG TPA: histidine--tRNA ligase [Vicinamibacterales bacterium]|nr:histidine--tRNA ligase [Vicinamibacterales bacterium]
MSTQPARGMRDFLPEDVRRREYVVGVIRRVYERYGFEPLETPAVENIETLLGKYGEEGNKLIFKILKRGEHEASGEADLALRYDLTVPLARVVAEHQATLPKFFKRYQIQPVWRADRPARGRFREFYQCDIDAIGSTSPVVEVEVLSAVSDVLHELGFRDFTIRLNDRRLLTALLESAGVGAGRHGEALVALDKLDKIGVDGVRGEFAARGIDLEAFERLLPLFGARPAAAGGDAGLSALRTFVAAHEAGVAALDNVATIVRLTQGGPAGRHVRVDPSLARGLSYYTGAIMEIQVPDLAGSLGGGGRYDNLVGMFLGRDLPACGFSLGLERILVVMGERGMFPPDVAAAAACDLLVTIWNQDAMGDALALAGEFRQAGLRVEVYPEADKLGKQLKYASSRQVPFVAVVGDDERAQGTVSLKDLRSGAQQAVPRAGAPAFVQAAIRR